MSKDRNKPCYCGSGKKYKKCHLIIERILMDDFHKSVFEKNKLKEKGIYINYVSPIIFQGKKVWALGSRVYAGRDPNETFHDFIQFFLKETLGFDWIEEQKYLKPEEQHLIIKCFLEFDKWKQELLVEKSKSGPVILIEAPPNGWIKSMLALAFDVATLSHESHLSDHLLRRLRINQEYQGVRYEIMAAAIFARLGFKIKWIEDRSERHCEFIATHEGSKTEIAIEVKSRHRSGVLHTPGNPNEVTACKGDIQGLLNKAYTKSEYGKMPFIIFIDVNAPFIEKEDFKEIPWVRDILNRTAETNAISKEIPSPHNATYFTNFSFHYQTDKLAKPGQSLQAIPSFVLHSIPDKSLFDGILRALNSYGNIPDIT